MSDQSGNRYVLQSAACHSCQDNINLQGIYIFFEANYCNIIYYFECLSAGNLKDSQRADCFMVVILTVSLLYYYL